ncbi:M48 family metalloprotease [Aridibaculum aurantiacum]|uniref:M48 family metalloprotease n=1 Tax=Aridibaculum aurantiacum TaxID=2810307 RepID=UPI001A975883|nr:M48 family metalloprotease [Aridibaculum aurantiacum]
MKKIIVGIGLFIACSSSSYSQEKWKLYDYHQGSYINTTVTSFTSAEDARHIIESIIAVIGLQPKFEIKEANIPNAAAVIYGSKRYILYNPKFVAALNKAAGNQWASVSILAHEIGHHLNGHTLEAGGSRPPIELEADEFSGFVLRKMGATLAEAQVAMKVAAGQRASHTHPAQADRLYAIAKGWNNANKMETASGSDVARVYKTPAPSMPATTQERTSTQQRDVATTTMAIDKRYIAKKAYFAADPSSTYFVTVRNNLVKVNGNNLQVIGKVAQSNSQLYPHVIYDENQNHLLISRSGSIVNTDGRRVGQLTDIR